MVLHGFAWRNPKTRFFYKKTENTNQNLKIRRKTSKNIIFNPGLGPMWAHMGPYGPIYGPMWAHMGPPGQVLEDSVDSVNFT